MKFIHTADLHLDSSLLCNLEPEQARCRKRELLDTFLRMVEYAGNQGVRAILIAGDMFDSKNILVKTRKEVLKAMESHPEIDFLYLKGNHDADGFLSTLSELPSNLKTFSDAWTSYDYGEVVITGAELLKTNAMHLFETLNLNKNRTNIVMLHGQIAEYSGAAKEQAERIPLTSLRGRGIDYLALGHIHSYITGLLDERGAYVYAGCPEGRGFDETGDKGFVLLDTAEGCVNYEFVPFACRRISERFVDVSGLETTTEVREAISDASIQSNPDLMLKITLTGEVGAGVEFDTDLLTKQFKDDFYCLKIKDETKLHINYEDYRYDHSLKGEFIRRVLESELPKDLQRRVIMSGLKALRGEALK